jgi:hypothetical protein
VTALRKPDRRQFTRAAVAVVGIGAAGFGLWLLAGFAGPNLGANTSYQQVQATVTSTASCASANASDTVSFTLGGRRHTGGLSGCGNPTGSTVAVLVPAGFADGGTVNLAAAAPGNAAGLSQRVSFLLLLLAAAVGGATAYFFARHPGPGKPRRARATGAEPGVETAGDVDPAPLGPPEISQDLPAVELTEAHEIDWFEDSSTDLRADSGDGP